jgi:hypothetical protein
MSTASESMKALTQRVLKADLASRNKRRVFSGSGTTGKNMATTAIFMWAIWVKKVLFSNYFHLMDPIKVCTFRLVNHSFSILHT